MAIQVQQQSSLEKIFSSQKEFQPPYLRGSTLQGEEFAYQVAVRHDGWGLLPVIVTVDSLFAGSVGLFQVKEVPCQLAAYPDSRDEDYISTSPGVFPDLLEPLEDGKSTISSFLTTVFWVNVTVPAQTPAGEYPIQVKIQGQEEEETAVFTLEVVGRELPKQQLLYTQWFYVDCIADYYQVQVYSEAHWELIGKFMEMAANGGMNMILTPVFTPALDTEIGKERTCVQLMEAKKKGESYTFDFSKLRRFCTLALEKGITHFEVSHLFTQWGAGFAPCIYVEEDGVRSRKFGWDTPGDSPAYVAFLSQLLPALTGFFKENGLEKQVLFHISDEPGEAQQEGYRKAKEIVKPYLQGFLIRDALSEYRFVESGLVEAPIVANNHIMPFLEHQVPDLWAYYCCAQNVDVSNRFLAMPSYRNRALWVQLYKYQITGFLHWGFNFYNSQCSRAQIDPFRVTDAGGAFPGGDPFSVYPGKTGPLFSLRQKVFLHCLQDLRALSLLESLRGREKAEAVIEKYEEITFSSYPRNAQYYLDLRERINMRIKEIVD